jgi:hypothetical protein
MKVILQQVFDLFQPYFLSISDIEDPKKIKEPVIVRLHKYDISMGTRFALKQIMRKLEPVSLDIEEERKKLMEEFGDRDDKGALKILENGRLHFSDDNFSKFNDKLSEFLKKEIDIDFIPLDKKSVEHFEIDEIGFSRLEFIIA